MAEGPAAVPSASHRGGQSARESLDLPACDVTRPLRFLLDTLESFDRTTPRGRTSAIACVVLVLLMVTGLVVAESNMSRPGGAGQVATPSVSGPGGSASSPTTLPPPPTSSSTTPPTRSPNAPACDAAKFVLAASNGAASAGRSGVAAEVIINGRVLLQALRKLATVSRPPITGDSLLLAKAVNTFLTSVNSSSSPSDTKVRYLAAEASYFPLGNTLIADVRQVCPDLNYGA